MTNTICGHERDHLIWALRIETAPNAVAFLFDHSNVAPYDTLETLEDVDRIGKLCLSAQEATRDPAKLAAMMAWELRRLRVGAMHRGVAPKLSYPMVILDHDDYCVRVRVRFAQESEGRDAGVTTMPQARALLLAWLRLPDGAHEEALRVLRGAQ